MLSAIHFKTPTVKNKFDEMNMVKYEQVSILGDVYICNILCFIYEKNFVIKIKHFPHVYERKGKANIPTYKMIQVVKSKTQNINGPSSTSQMCDYIVLCVTVELKRDKVRVSRF